MRQQPLYLLLLLAMCLLASCEVESDGCSFIDGPLPILGERDLQGNDTIFHTVRDFEFINQDSQIINNATFDQKAYVVDFFFISCPSICPKVTRSMLRIHDEFKAEEGLLLLAHTIDVKYDTIPRLKQYAENLGVSSEKWHFVTGDKDEIFDIADDYFSVAVENADAPGGFDHSGRLILIDKKRQVRSFCDGTDPASVDCFIQDIQKLLKEEMAD